MLVATVIVTVVDRDHIILVSHGGGCGHGDNVHRKHILWAKTMPENVLNFIKVTTDSLIYYDKPHNDSMLQQNSASLTSSDSHLGGMWGRILFMQTISCISSKEGSLGTQLKYGRR